MIKKNDCCLFCMFDHHFLSIHYMISVLYLVLFHHSEISTSLASPIPKTKSLFGKLSFLSSVYLLSGFFPGVVRGMLYPPMRLSFRFRKVLVQLKIRCCTVGVGEEADSGKSCIMHRFSESCCYTCWSKAF